MYCYKKTIILRRLFHIPTSDDDAERKKTMTNTLLLFTIAGAGILLTIILCITGKKERYKPSPALDVGTITVFNIAISITAFLYLVRLVIMAFTGILSNAYEQILIGILCALLPPLILVLTTMKTSHTRER